MSSKKSTLRRRMCTKAEPSELAVIRRFVEEVAVSANLRNSRVFDLKVAVSEACANAVEHAGRNRGQLEVTALHTCGRLTFEILDTGAFHVPEADLASRRENRGLGLPLMVALMDEVNISRLREEGTRVTLSVFLDHPVEAADTG